MMLFTVQVHAFREYGSKNESITVHCSRNRRLKCSTYKYNEFPSSTMRPAVFSNVATMFLVVACHVAPRNRSIRNSEQIEWKTKPRKLARQFTIASFSEIEQNEILWPFFPCIRFCCLPTQTVKIFGPNIFI